MRVKELITELLKLDEDKEVYVNRNGRIKNIKACSLTVYDVKTEEMVVKPVIMIN